MGLLDSVANVFGAPISFGDYYTAEAAMKKVKDAGISAWGLSIEKGGSGHFVVAPGDLKRAIEVLKK